MWTLRGLNFSSQTLLSFPHQQTSWVHYIVSSFLPLQEDFISYHFTEVVKDTGGSLGSRSIPFSALILLISQAVFTPFKSFPSLLLWVPLLTGQPHQYLLVLWCRYCLWIYLTSFICFIHSIVNVLAHDMTSQILGHHIASYEYNCLLYIDDAQN